MNMTFEEWINVVFDHPCIQGGWYWDDAESEKAGAVAVQLSEAVKLSFLTQLFETSGTALAKFSDQQVGDSLNYLVSNACSDYMFAWKNKAIAWPEKKRFLESIYQLFAECFAKRCSLRLSHKDTFETNPLNTICYMWWDVIPIHGDAKNSARTEADAMCLEVMQKTLQLDSIACQEAALHGLGHWHMHYPKKVEAIIDEFLASGRCTNLKLKKYAMNARRGYVQ